MCFGVCLCVFRENLLVGQSAICVVQNPLNKLYIRAINAAINLFFLMLLFSPPGAVNISPQIDGFYFYLLMFIYGV